MAQRLTADDYWQKVNEVYASGQGEVAMAFIKDDLGNWDLKSFSNDPADLLASYRRVTYAALKTAADLATKAASGGAGDAARLLNAAKATQLANQLATGEAPATPGVVGGINLAALHDRTAARLAAQKDRFARLEAEQQAERDKQTTAAGKAADDAKTADDQAKSATDALKEATSLRDAAIDTEASKRALLDTERGREKPVGADVNSAETALNVARRDRAEKQANVDAKQAEVLAAQTKAAKLRTDADEAKAKAAAADQRLKDLPKEAIEAVKGTLDDHLAVIAALQEGVASASQPGPATTLPALPKP